MCLHEMIEMMYICFECAVHVQEQNLGTCERQRTHGAENGKKGNKNKQIAKLMGP